MRRHPWLTATIVLVAVCAVLFFCLEWRAEQRWRRYAADARGHGVKLLLSDFARPEIPDEQNFAALPMMRKAFAGPAGESAFTLPDVANSGADHLPFPKGDRPPVFGDITKAQEIVWSDWQKYFQAAGFLTELSDNPPADVLRALDHYAPQFQEWSEWRKRPRCRFPLDFTKGMNIPFSHLSTFQRAVKVFALRMRAHLAVGDSAAAYVDFQDGLQTYRALREEPVLISGLVRIANLHVLLAGVGDGLRDRTWQLAELARIETDLAAIRVWDDWRLALESERGYVNSTMESWLRASMRERGKMVAETFAFGGRNPTQEMEFRFCPRMVFRDNQLRQNQYLDELLARIDTAHQTIDIDRPAPSSAEQITDIYERLHYFLFATSAGAFGGVEQRYVQLQTLLDEARLACALERFRASRGTYPERLADLAPEYIATIPTDIYARAPYRYQRLGETSFRLYSVGQNRTDDGGQLVPGVQERKQLDALWIYAPPAPATPP
ncbi:MAG: hypothetical protein ABJF10_14895 [Chthoniobacter sp.]|uniref:hypothetical protein n=1 Tax=Chthoniobacter sp. TaxID=2510640 RepID=UPI0032A94897